MIVSAKGYKPSQPIEVVVNESSNMIIKNVTLLPRKKRNRVSNPPTTPPTKATRPTKSTTAKGVAEGS